MVQADINSILQKMLNLTKNLIIQEAILAFQQNLKGIKFSKSIEVIHEEFDQAGLLILDIFVEDEKGNDDKSIQGMHPDYEENKLSSWQILQSLQILRLEFRQFLSGSVKYRVRLAFITELGAKFYFACHDKDFSMKRSDEVRFSRNVEKIDRTMDYSDLYRFDFSLEYKCSPKRTRKNKPSEGTS